jgi:glycosyl transferase family 4
MRIAQIAPLFESVPPRLYGGTEWVVSYLTEELVRQGHQVTLFASGDSITSAMLVPCTPCALRLDPNVCGPLPHHMVMLDKVAERAGEFDVLHFHIDYPESSLPAYAATRVQAAPSCPSLPFPWGRKANAGECCGSARRVTLGSRILEEAQLPVFPRSEHKRRFRRSCCITGDVVMASNAGIFFAGLGTTFIILGAGFGGGLMMATSALKEPVGYQKHTSDEPPPPARVILPSTAEAAQPPQPSQQTATAEEPPLPPTLQQVELAVQKQVEKVDTKKAESEQRERRKRYAERKARRQAESAKRQQQIEHGESQEAPILAFVGDEHRRNGGFGFFGN